MDATRRPTGVVSSLPALGLALALAAATGCAAQPAEVVDDAVEDAPGATASDTEDEPLGPDAETGDPGADGAPVGTEPEALDGASQDDAIAPGQAPAETVAALDFSARSLGGGTVDVAAWSGDPVALWMWAPW